MIPSSLICKRFALSQEELQTYAGTCPYRYKTYKIDKRDGGKRIISQPSRDLKTVQRYILETFLSSKLLVHESAKAYKADTNILDNAKPHLKNKYLLKMDFKSFFPSIKDTDFVKYLMEKNIVNEESEALLLSRIFFKKEHNGLRLSIGSPGSPIISNALLYEFDHKVAKECQTIDVAFTRYSDDLTFSTNHRNILFEWPSIIKTILSNLDYPTLKLNGSKTVFSSTKFNRHVTGITITNDGLASVGRRKKRELRTRVFNADNLNPPGLEKLRGHIAFASQVEPLFLEKLWEKYPTKMRLIKNQE